MSTLIIYPGRVDWPIDGSRRIASSMANAELVDIDAEGSPFQGGDSEPALNLINEFLGVNAGRRRHSRDGERADGPLAGLTRRELEILSLIARGETNQGIASSLTLSPSTVARHTANIYMKLDIHNRAQATARYLGRS